MASACADVVAETDDLPSLHAAATGWYSHGVLARVLQNTIPPKWHLRLNALVPSEVEDFCADPNALGALLNEDNLHWLAIVKHGGELWHVDSRHMPRLISVPELLRLLEHYPSTFPLLDVASLS